MDIRAKIIRTNTNLLQELEKVSTLNQSILEQEIFTTEQSQQNSDKLQREKDALQKAEEKISHLSDNLNEYGFSKEGVGIQEMVTEWLTACINEAKAKAEVKVLVDRQRDILTRRHSNQAERTCRRHCRRQLSPTNRRPCRSTPPFAEYQDDNCQPAGHSIPRVSADRQWQKKNYLRPCRILRQYDIHKRLLPAD